MIETYAGIEKKLMKQDATLAKIIENNQGKIKPHPSVDIYLELLNAIVSQQLSIKVAAVIWKRFLDLFVDQYPAVEDVINFEISELRQVGLSNSKAKYIQNVAQFASQHTLDFDELNKKTDVELIQYLTQIKGIGNWTAQMILMFAMDRPDVFPVDDLGIMNKMKKIYQIDLPKKELQIKLSAIAEHWKPYRSLASKHIWYCQLD